MNYKKSTVGSDYIIIQGFGTYIYNLIEYQSMPDSNFIFLLNYVEYGIKVPASKSIIAKIICKVT